MIAFLLLAAALGVAYVLWGIRKSAVARSAEVEAEHYRGRSEIASPSDTAPTRTYTVDDGLIRWNPPHPNTFTTGAPARHGQVMFLGPTGLFYPYEPTPDVYSIPMDILLYDDALVTPLPHLPTEATAAELPGTVINALPLGFPGECKVEAYCVEATILTPNVVEADTTLFHQAAELNTAALPEITRYESVDTVSTPADVNYTTTSDYTSSYTSTDTSSYSSYDSGSYSSSDSGGSSSGGNDW
jgi:hypothetical protein